MQIWVKDIKYHFDNTYFEIYKLVKKIKNWEAHVKQNYNIQMNLHKTKRFVWNWM